MAGGPIPGRTIQRNWQAVMDRPDYALGTWLGRTHHGGDWTILSAGCSRPKITTSFQVMPRVAPHQLSPSEMPAEPSQQTRKPDYGDDRYFDEKMDLARPVDVSELDRDEMGVDFVLATDGTKWKR